jgi:hypothetical protein
MRPKPGTPKPEGKNMSLFVPAEYQPTFDAARLMLVVHRHKSLAEYLVSLMRADIEANKAKIHSFVDAINCYEPPK